MKKKNKYELSGNPISWTSQDKKRYEHFVETIAYMEKVLEDNGFLIRNHTMLFSGDKFTYTIHFGGCQYLTRT